jgi:acyl-CoA thioesterase YciA
MKKYTYEYLVMPKHLNPHGSLFGGQLISWIDESVYMAIKKLSDHNSVTALIKNFNFLKSAYVNDMVQVVVEISSVGNKSCECSIKAFCGNKHKELIADSHFVMVTVDKLGRPIPVFPEERESPSLKYKSSAEFKLRQEYSLREQYRDICENFAWIN